MKCYHYEGALQYYLTIVLLRPLCILCHSLLRGSHPLPDQLHREHTGLPSTFTCKYVQRNPKKQRYYKEYLAGLISHYKYLNQGAATISMHV